MRARYYHFCSDCKRRLVRIDKATGMELPAVSKWPWCQPCRLRRMDDPDFKSWIIRRLRGNKVLTPKTASN